MSKSYSVILCFCRNRYNASNFYKELVKNDFDKNGFQIDTFQRDWIETLNSMNNEVDEFITSDPNVTKNFSES